MNEKKREVVEPHRTDSPVDRWPTLRRFGEGSGAAPLNREESEYLEPKQLYRELQVQRSELEQQNEELRLARVEIEAGLQKYYELYDFAPVGYCTIDRQGIVRESNLAGALLLAVDRPRLLNRCLGDFVPREARSGLDLFLDRVFSEDSKATGEIPITDGEKGERHLYLEGAAFDAASGERLGRIAMMDVTEFRKARIELEHYRYHLEELVQQRTCQLEEANIQLREQAENLASIYQALDSIGLIVCDLIEDDALINIFNIGAEKLFGLRQEEVSGKSIALIYPVGNRSIFPEQVRALHQGQTM